MEKNEISGSTGQALGMIRCCLAPPESGQGSVLHAAVLIQERREGMNEKVRTGVSQEDTLRFFRLGMLEEL